MKLEELELLQQEVKQLGRPRKKDYSKLSFDYCLQLKQGVYLIYNDTLGVRYVGMTEESFSERFSKRENEYQRFMRGDEDKCAISSKILFEHEDSRMEWLFIPFEKMTERELGYIEDLCMQHFEYHGEIINIEKSKDIILFDESIMGKGEWNIPLFVKYNVMEGVK